LATLTHKTLGVTDVDKQTETKEAAGVSQSASSKLLAGDRRKLEWRVHTANLLQEILNNLGTGTLHIPLNIFARLLMQVGERAAELNDEKLNKLMMQLTIYSAADPLSEDYDQDAVDYYLHG